MEVYDAIIAGGGTSGVACAYILAKHNIKTLIIENANSLGGSITNGLVVPAMKTNSNDKNEFLEDFIKILNKFNGRLTFPMDENQFWINPQIAKIAMDEMLKKVNCDILFNTNVSESVYSEKENEIEYISAKSLFLNTNDQVYTQKTSKNLSLYIEQIQEKNLKYKLFQYNNISLLFYIIENNILSIYIEQDDTDKIKDVKIFSNKNFELNFNSDTEKTFEFIKVDSDKIFATSCKFENNILSIYIKQNDFDTANKIYIKIADKNLKKSEIAKMNFKADFYIDATADGALSLLSGENKIDFKQMFQYATLRFNVANVDLRKFSKFLLEIDKNREISPVYEIDGHIHLSTAFVDDEKSWGLKPFFENAVKNRVLEKEDIAYFQIFTIANCENSIAFNCPRIFTIVNDAKTRSKALIEGRERILRIFKFCKKTFPGFEKAFISEIASLLGVRVSNNIAGKHIFTKEEMQKGKKFDLIALSSDYPVDIHGKNNNNIKFLQRYYLPLESLQAKKNRNLYIIGRNASFDFEAQSALRVQISCFQMAQAVANHIINIKKKL